MKDCLKLFEEDHETRYCCYWRNRWTEKLKLFDGKAILRSLWLGSLLDRRAPPGRRMGHAGAIVSGGDDTAIAKMKILNECGIIVAESVAEIGSTMKKELKGKIK